MQIIKVSRSLEPTEGDNEEEEEEDAQKSHRLTTHTDLLLFFLFSTCSALAMAGERNDSCQRKPLKNQAKGRSKFNSLQLSELNSNIIFAIQ